MHKTLTLSPICITADSAFEGILNGSSDYRTVPKGGNPLHVGVIGFDYSPLRRLSGACTLASIGVQYEQKGGSVDRMAWGLDPLELTAYTINGKRLTVYGSSGAGDSASTGSNDNDYHKFDYNFRNVKMTAQAFASSLFAVELFAINYASVFDQKLYMKDIALKVTYTAKYYAKFYSDGTLLKTQTVDGESRATAPGVNKTGYAFKGWQCAGTTYAANNLPTSVDTDLRFDAVWERIYYKVALPQSSTGSCRVTNLNGQYNYSITNNATWVAHGDSIRVYADGFNTRAQNLLVKVNGGAASEIDGSSGGEVLIYEGAVAGNLTIELSTKTVSFPLTVTATGGGEVSAPASITRFANAKISVAAYIGFYISSITLDGVVQTVGDDALWEYTMENVQAPHSIDVVFARVQVPVTFDVDEHVTVTDESGADVTAGTVVDYGSTPTFTFCVPAGWSLDTLTRDDETLLEAFGQVCSFDVESVPVNAPTTFRATETDDLVTVAIQQSAGGTIAGESGLFIRGKGSLSFSVTVDSDWEFLHWFNGSYDLSITLPINEDVTVSAAIREMEYVANCIVINGVYGDGRLGKDGDHVGLNVHYDDGDDVVVPFVPNEGYVLDHVYCNDWTGRVYDIPWKKSSPFVFENAHGWLALDFYFTIGNWNITLDASNPEAGNRIQINSNEKAFNAAGTFVYREEVTLTAHPATGWHFAYWSDDPTNSTNPRTFVTPGHDTVITAVFKKDTFFIDTAAENGGAVTAPQAVEFEDSFILEITADFGQRIADVLLDGVSILDDVTLTRRGGRYLLEKVTAKHTFAVTFEPKTYTNSRKLFDYWPPVIQSIRDMQEIARVQQPVIDELWDAMSWLLESQFIDTATEEAVKIWEAELGVIPNASDTLRQRKARLRLKWVPCNRFTIRWLHHWLCDVTQRSDITRPLVPENTYGLTVHLPYDADWQTIFGDLERYKPCNIYLDPHVDLQSSKMRVLAGFAVGSKRTVVIKDEKQAEREESQ